MSSQTPSERPGRFPTTQWSRVILAGDPDAPLAKESLAELCNAYWYPLYAYIRRRGFDPEKAKDLTQDFFVRALEKGLLAEVDPARGRFRSFLRKVCANFLANRRDWEHARKRGGGRTILPIDAAGAEGQYARELADGLTPERIFDRSWALALLGRVLDQLGREYDEAGKAATFEALRGVLAGDTETSSYALLATRLGTTEGAARGAVARAADPDLWRCRLRDALDLESTDRERARAAFEELAATAPQDALHCESLSRLAFALGSLGKKEMATSLLRGAQRAHPDDFWINYDLARSLMGTGRPDEAARFFTAAMAIRPRSDLALRGLREALRTAGRPD